MAFYLASSVFLVEEWDYMKFEVHVDTALLTLKADGEVVVEIVEESKKLINLVFIWKSKAKLFI